MDEAADTAASFETEADAGEGEPGLVNLWLEAIRLQKKTEETWRKKAKNAVERYRDEKDRKGRRFNILFANVTTTLPAVYNSTPIPDVRRRFGDPDPVGKIASQVLERALSYSADAYDFDGAMRAMCWDGEVVGRGVLRVRYEPTLAGEGEEQRIVGEAVTCEYVDWCDFIRGPGRRWSEVPWVAFEHRLTRDELVERFGSIGKTMPLDFVVDGAKGEASELADVFKRATVFEVWDKQRRRVLFVSEGVPEKALQVEDDPLGLSGFFPVPRPYYTIQDTGSLVPMVPFEIYRDQAEELDRVTARITALVNVLRYRGLRAAEIAEFSALADAQDGDYVPVQNVQQFLGAAGGGGLEKLLWTMPIDGVIAVVRELVLHREQIKAVIYEITGLSDILRGASQASETATAQQIKAQWGSLRIQDRQAEVQRVARDLYRMKAELIAEKFQPETLAMMTGTELPSGEVKAQAQQAIEGGIQDEMLAQIVAQPSWDEVMAVLRSDAMRAYRVDIETDSTIQADVARSQQNAAQFVQGFGGFVQAMGPAVEAGVMPLDVATDLLTAFARQFKLGRQAEDALERLSNQPKQPQQPDQAAMQMQAEAEAKKAEAAATAEIEREKIGSAERMKAAELASQEKVARLQIASQERVATGMPPAPFTDEVVTQQTMATLAQIVQQMDGIGQAVQGLVAQQEAPVQAIRGPDGQIAEVQKGGRTFRVIRGPDGAVAGLA